MRSLYVRPNSGFLDLPVRYAYDIPNRKQKIQSALKLNALSMDCILNVLLLLLVLGSLGVLVWLAFHYRLVAIV
jgi:hypothetical protein